jgi:hypothetical protein
MADLYEDWTEFLSLLIAHRVRFVLVGGHAVAVHARPRHTEDLDVFVEPTKVNAKRLHDVLAEFGFAAVSPSIADLAKSGKVFMLGRKPYRIDVLTGIDGVSFRKAWSGRLVVELAAGKVPVIGKAELIANKRAAGRDKDLADLVALRPKAHKRKR